MIPDIFTNQSIFEILSCRPSFNGHFFLKVIRFVDSFSLQVWFKVAKSDISSPPEAEGLKGGSILKDF